MNDSTIWIAAGAILTAVSGVIGWLLLNERRMGKLMTREEHDRICETRTKQMGDDLKEIKEFLRDREAEAREHREKMANSMHAVGLQVAVMQTQVKQLLGDSA